MSTASVPGQRAWFPRGIRLSRLLIYAVLCLFCLSTILAFGWVFMVSLKSTSEFLTTSPWALPEQMHFENYVKAWEKARMFTYFGNSIWVAGFGASLSVAVSALAAYVISRVPFKLNEVLANYFIVGYMLPLMLTVIPLYFLVRDIGIGAGYLPLVSLYIASGVPFNTLVLRGFFESLPQELEEAAAMDGASPFRTFWQIMLPLSWPGLVSTFLINFLSLWNEFFIALIFLKRGERDVAVGTVSNGSTRRAWGAVDRAIRRHADCHASSAACLWLAPGPDY